MFTCHPLTNGTKQETTKKRIITPLLPGHHVSPDSIGVLLYGSDALSVGSISNLPSSLISSEELPVIT